MALPPIFVRTTVENPVRLSGSADVFEAQFYVDITRDRKVLGSHAIQATSGSGTRGTWEIALELPVGKCILVFYEVSMKDGSHVNEVSVPLLVK